MTASPKADYGFDGGYVLPGAALASLALLVVAAVLHLRGPMLAGACSFLILAVALHTSRRGKLLVWNELVDQLPLRGSERVLDLGCGRGAVLLSVAKRLTSGRAVGVDLWSRVDQSGNSARALRRNAAAEAVAGRIEPLTADMRALPFPADTFDLIVSNIAIHNIKGRAGRAQAIDEAVRVLRPGGRLLVADLSFTRAYSQRLAELGMAEIGRRSLGWRMWWGGPWRATWLVTTKKPEREPRAAASRGLEGAGAGR